MLMALDSKNKTGFVDGLLPKPEVNHPQFRSWMRNNSKVSSWLLNSVSKEISASIIYAANAAEIWKELHDRLQQKNGPRVFQLKKNLLNCTQGSSTVSSYFTQFKYLWEELGEFRPIHNCIFVEVYNLSLIIFKVSTFLLFLRGLMNLLIKFVAKSC